MPVDRSAALKWVTDPPSRRQRAWYYWLRLYHHALPGVLDTPLSAAGTISLAVRIFSVAGIVLSPIWIELITNLQMPRGATATIAIIMIVLKFGDWIAPKIRKLGGSEDEKRRQEDEYATRQFNIFREIFSSLPEDCLPDDGHWRARLADKVLSCILHVVKSRIIANADSLQVTLLSFSGEHAEGLKIVSRAKDTRPSEIKRKADQTIAYYAAVTGKVVIVNDLRSQPVFPKTGLSSEKATYRSILLVPVIPHGNGHKDCVGVLTVDSPKPCEFWGDIGDNIATQLIPLVHILTVLMKSGYPRIAIEEA